MDKRIHPKLDVRNFDHAIAGIGDVAHNPAFTQARRARQALADGAMHLHNAKAALDADSTRTPADKSRKLSETAEAVLRRATDNASKAEEGLRRKARDADQQIASELRMAAPPEAAEIRAHIKNMDVAERTTFLRRAIQSGDKETAGAVLAARPYLSGLGDKEVSMVRREAERAFCADSAALRDAATAAADEMGNAVYAFYGEYRRLNDPQQAQKAAQQRQASEQAIQAAERLEPIEAEADPDDADGGDAGDEADAA
jgi:hypothetical protein